MRQGFSNGSATLASTFDYSAFGEKIGGNGGSSSPYGWGAQSGYRQDGGSGQGDCGLVLMGARWYDPAVGRFTSRDSDITQSAYVYCSGDPINLTDPSGHEGVSSDGALGLAAAGIVALIAIGLALAAVVTFPLSTVAFTIYLTSGFIAGAMTGEGFRILYENKKKESDVSPGHDPREPVAPKGGVPGGAGLHSVEELYKYNNSTGVWHDMGPADPNHLPPGTTQSPTAPQPHD